MSPAAKIGAAIATALVAGLAWINWQLVEAPVDISPIAPPRVGTVPQRPGDEPSAAAAFQSTTMRDTVERVLFSPTRRPPQPAEKPATRQREETKEQTSDLRLVGVMKSAEAKWRALIRAEAGAEWHGVGANVAGWRLAEINAERVVLEERGRRIELTLVPPTR
jgi:hypothetical protein